MAILRVIVSFAAAGTVWAASDFAPPRIPALRAAPRWERLFEKQVTHLLSNTPVGEIPNELEHAIRPLAATALSCAACVKFAGCDRRALDLARRLVAELTRTHLTGGGRTASGRAWGHHWQSALWAWQTAFGAWLIWNDLDADVRRRVIAMTVDEADRFVDLPPPYSRFYDTKAEENAWNALILVLAGEALEGHPHQARWRERALEYMVSAFAAPRDRRSSAMLDGRRLSEWIHGVNIHDDFTLENHGFVHPDYMSTTSLNLGNAVVYRLLGRAVPKAVFHNAREIYENLKFFSLPDGGLLYASGTDWNLHRVDMTAELHVQMERLMGDRDAGALAGAALDTLEKMQARNADGRTFAPGEFPSYPTHESNTAWLYAFSLMTARLWDPPSSPRPPAEVWRSLEGSRVFDDARMFVVRTPEAVSSFSWGLRLMGQTVPMALDTILNPLPHSYVGLVQPVSGAMEKPGRLGIGSAALYRALDADPISISTVIAGEENEVTHVTVRTSHSGRPHVFSFAALPTGKTIYMERWGGKGQALGGLVSATEDPQWVHGTGQRAIEQDGRTWLNIDGRLGYAISGGGGIRRISDVRNVLLALNENPQADAVIVTLPGADAGQTRRFAASGFRLESGHPDVAAAEVDGFTVAVNFSAHPTTVTLSGRAPIAVNGHSARVARR